MADVIGQVIEDLITVRAADETGISGLTEGDFEVLSAFLLTDETTTAAVELEELSDGLYVGLFTPEEFGKWVFRYKYAGPPIRQDEFVHNVVSTAEISIITAGGTWTYNGDLTDPMQEVRFLIQDTDGSYPLFTDTEVAYALGSAGSHARGAAVLLVQRLMARYSAMADTTELDLSVRASQLFTNAKMLLDSLNNPFLAGGSAKPYAGGISYGDITARESNTDRVFGVFDRTRYSDPRPRRP